MQAAKDSFYVELRNRLVAVDPQRTVTLDGAARPAIAVVENEPADCGPPLGDTFYLHLGECTSGATRSEYADGGGVHDFLLDPGH